MAVLHRKGPAAPYPIEPHIDSCVEAVVAILLVCEKVFLNVGETYCFSLVIFRPERHLQIVNDTRKQASCHLIGFELVLLCDGRRIRLGMFQ